MATQNDANKKPAKPHILTVSRPLRLEDDFYELSICPCEEESIQPTIETYHIAGEKVQYEGPEKPQVFREAAIIADRLVCADVENAQQQPSDDEFSDTEPEPEPEPPQFEMVLLDIPDDKTLIDESAEVEFEDDSEEETAQIAEVKMSQEDLAVAGPSGLQRNASRQAPGTIEVRKETATNYISRASTSTHTPYTSTRTDLKTSKETLDEEPQELHDALVRSLQDQEQEPKGILELVLDEEDERYRKEVEGDYYERLISATSDAPAISSYQFPEMINLTNSGVNRILPKSQWGPEIKPLELTDETYKILVAAMENILRRLLTSLNYDSITNFMQFHDYTQNVDVADSSVYELYQRFRPTIYRPSSTCVGLTLELLRRWQCLRFIFPGLIWAMAPLSCEESGPNIQHDAKITSGAHELYIPDKEHLLAGVHVRLHTRAGLLLSDPGYHVARIVTVMLDKEHPHTGEFQQVNEQGSRKFYEYTFCDTNSGSGRTEKTKEEAIIDYDNFDKALKLITAPPN